MFTLSAGIFADETNGKVEERKALGEQVKSKHGRNAKGKGTDASDNAGKCHRMDLVSKAAP
jgi:hypothetical protein